MKCTRLLTWVTLATLALGPARASEDIDIARWVTDGVDSGEAMAIAAAWYDGSEVRRAHAGALGGDTDAMPDAQTQFQIGSISKVYTNLLLAEMVARGKVGYDTTVAELTGDTQQFRNEAVGEITLEALATHTSGLPRMPANFRPSDPGDPFASYTAAQLSQGLNIARAKQPLGDHYAYSNLGVGLLGYLLGEAHGGGYTVALEAYVLGPLGAERTGMTASGKRASASSGGEVVPDWQFDALAGAGALWGTTTDLLALAAVMRGNTDNPFQSAIEDLLAPTGFTAGSFSVTRVWHTAPAGDATIYWHNGRTNGFGSFVGVRSDDGRAIALLVSGDGDPTRIGLQWLGYERPESAPTAYDASLFGTYELNPNVQVRVIEREGQLTGQVSGQPPLPLTPLDDDWYTVDTFDASFRVVREAGEVVALELVQNSVVQVAKKISNEVVETPEPVEVALEDEALDAFVGQFAMMAAPVTFTVRRREGGLEVQLTGQPFFPVFAKGDDVFFYKVVEAELHFERDEAGSVNALMLHQGGIRQRATRVTQ
ncbi:MAG: serine hydrolase domain-containing protein [Pseudomonadota bacterium]